MDKKVIYLCGPVKDVTEAEANAWRQKATKYLEPYFDILDPMRRKFNEKDGMGINEIVRFDLEDVRAANILLVNYNKVRPETTFCGTSMEVREAYTQGKFIVAFTDLPESELSPWMRYHCTRIVKNIHEAVEYIRRHFIK